MNREPNICLSSTPIPVDDTDRKVIGIGNRLKRELEQAIARFRSEADALGVSINVCGTVDLVRYTKERKRGYNAVQAAKTDVNYKELSVNIWL